MIGVSESVTHDFAPVDLLDVVRYAGASGDFNRVHYDPTLARQAGYPDAFAQGMLTAGLLGVAVAELMGVTSLRSFGVRFVSPLWLGDRPTATMTIVEREESRTRVELELAVDGRVVTRGWAEVLSRAAGADSNE